MQKSKTNDNELIKLILKGDTLLFGHLVDRYKDVSFSLACSVLKNEQEAEDALQDAFIKCFQKLSTFKQESKFSTWLYTIVVNTCKSRLRKLKPETIIDTSEIEIEDHEYEISGFEALEQNELTEMVNSTLNKLSKNEALLLRLFYLAEMSIKEIIEITQFSESMIKVTLHRARKNFAAKIESTKANALLS